MTSLTAIALVVGLGVTLPLYAGMEATIREHLERLARGERVPMIAIGCFTEIQFAAINEGRAAMELHLLEQNEILFMGRHLYASRSKDGYQIDDILKQIMSALCDDAIAHLDTFVSYVQNPNTRDDGYGNQVSDRAVFEMTARKPRAELYSVMPKGDTIKPNKKGRR
ncbi:hypothetical protein [Bradyrhizobium sp. sBnM-33]|uniref:hypothetical protein n=1 Tax=Bradyrhizobium sp. sBnM-33 TaxID=2831780 RepID=UPI001BD09C80|nr:hypothetical protein [Bradyrhizobium sp. sBnM-33]WOH52302.1 hypothetical protein RX328_08820 [Bradyrhizobium sp. sBnM-33]